MPDAAQAPREAALQTLFEALKPLSMAPLWTQYHAMLTPTPQGKARPYLWRYVDLRPHLLRAGELVSTREAERRVLMLMNPGLEGRAAATSTLFAGMQLILPGEIARAHRRGVVAQSVVHGLVLHQHVEDEGQRALVRTQARCERAGRLAPQLALGLVEERQHLLLAELARLAGNRHLEA